MLVEECIDVGGCMVKNWIEMRLLQLGVRVIITGRIIEDDAVVWVERVEAKDWGNKDLVLEPRLESVACDGDSAVVGVLEIGVILRLV